MNDESVNAEENARAERLAALDPAFSTSRGNVFAKELAVVEAANTDVTTDVAQSALGIIRQGLADMDPEIRADAAEALGFLKHADPADELRSVLNDDDGEVRTQAAVALIRLGDDAVFPAVVRALRHQDPRVIIGAAVVLGHLRDRRVVPNLIEAFKTDHEEVGAAVAWALGQCQDPACVPWLVTAVEQGFATANACEALGQIGDPLAFGTLRGVLHDAHEDVRAYAARAIGQLHFDGEEGPKSDAAISPLQSLLDDDSRKVRLCAALSLYDLGASRAKEGLASAVAGASEG